MLNHTFLKAFRTSQFSLNKNLDQATRKVSYENLKVHKTKYKSFAKDRKRAARRASIGGLLTPRDIGEDQPPFFMPARYKVYIKCLQEFRNSNRFTRKPMPDEVRIEFAKKSKEYQAYKQHEMR